jgi:hypothetical protein
VQLEGTIGLPMEGMMIPKGTMDYHSIGTTWYEH